MNFRLERGSSSKSHEINAAKNQLKCKALSTRIVFESFLSVRTKTLTKWNTMADIIVIRQLPFPSVSAKTISRRFQKNSTLGTVFENLRFWWPKTPLTCGRKAKQRKKSPFSKISEYVWTRPKYTR